MQDATKKALSVLQRTFGVDSTTLLADRKSAAETAIPTGNPVLDYGLLGIGGIPRGRFIEIYGKEKAGKTSLELVLIAAMQRAGIVPIVIDPKLSVADDPVRAVRAGVVPDDLVLIPIKTSEEASSRAQTVIKELSSQGVEVALFWDDASLTATRSSDRAAKVPKRASTKKAAVDEKKMPPAEMARVMWDFCRGLSGVCFQHNATMIVVNHLIAAIGSSFGGRTPSTTTGGGGVRAAARVRVKLTRTTYDVVSGVRVGQIVKMQTEANAYYRPFCSVDMYLDFNRGYDLAKSVLINAQDAGVVRKSRGKYKVKGVKLEKRPEDFTPEELNSIAARVWPVMGGDAPEFDDDDLSDSDAVDYDEAEAIEDDFLRDFE